MEYLNTDWAFYKVVSLLFYGWYVGVQYNRQFARKSFPQLHNDGHWL